MRFNNREYKALVGYKGDDTAWAACITQMEEVLAHWARFMELREPLSAEMLTECAIAICECGAPFPVLQAFVLDLVYGRINDFELYGVLSPSKITKAYKLWYDQTLPIRRQASEAAQKAYLQARKQAALVELNPYPNPYTA